MNDMSPHLVTVRATKQLAPTDSGLREAVRILKAGGLVAIPTETVYGLAADATNPAAVARIYAAKGRPVFNPLIAHFADAHDACTQGCLSVDAQSLATYFWPGPLTLVLPVRAETHVCELARAGLASVALRVPSHPVARDLLRACGFPLAAPSANRSGHVSPTSAGHVLADLDGLIDAVLDAGPCQMGIESTIISSLAGATALLRAGSITRAEVEAIIGHELTAHSESDGDRTKPIAPGLLSSHYAPRAKLRLDAQAPTTNEAYLAFGPGIRAEYDNFLNLSVTGDLTQAAANLYHFLRQLDATGLAGIAVAPIPPHGIGEAINDRLRRASAPRSNIPPLKI